MIFRRLKRYWIVLVVLVSAILVGCANPQADRAPSQDKWREMADKSVGHSPSSRKTREVDLQSPKTDSLGKPTDRPKLKHPLPSRTISLKMHLTEVPVLLRALARSVNLNIMINESVTGRISLNVQNAKWDQVFTGVLNSQGLDYEWEGDILRVVTLEDRDRHLKNLETEEKILSKKLELQTMGPLTTKIFPIDFASAEKIRENIEKILSPKKEGESKGAVMVDTHTNSLIVHATPSQIAQITPMITELDRPTPQILIEAYIVETSSRTARELGVQWGGGYYIDGGQNFWLTPNATSAANSAITGETVTPDAGTIANFPANLDNATQAGTGLVLGLLAQGKEGLLSFQLSALEEEGKLHILSSPSITTLDNSKAIIESGDEVPIPVVLDNTSNVIYKDALLSLEVTPHVIQQDALKLEIVTTKNEVDFTRTVLTYPTIVSKKASTNVILFDGQTTVIGGLKKDTNQNNEAGVPFVSKIPLLGYLFKNQGKSDQMQELLIFITPRILKPLAETSLAPSDATTKTP